MKHYKNTITMLLTAAVLLTAVFMTGCTKLWEAPNSTPAEVNAIPSAYFMGGREISLLSCSFLFVPMPLMVFPVLCFLCTAIWLKNFPAAIIMVIFGAAHLAVSLQSFR